MTIRIATRRSPLALWQAEHVAALLRSVSPGLDVELIPSDTFGDRRQDLSIPELGGKGVFSKEIQAMVLAGEADVAVHSAKDLQAITPDGLELAAIPERGDPRDALIGARLDDLSPGATVATGSNRRKALLHMLRPDLNVVGLRGNIATRLSKLGVKAAGSAATDGEPRIEALVMAIAAVERLQLEVGPLEVFAPDRFVPQVGQAALAVEVRSDDVRCLELVGKINHGPTWTTVTAERHFLQQLGGDCNLPAGAFAELLSDGPETVGSETAAPSGRVGGSKLRVLGVLASADGKVVKRQELVGLADDEPGREVARRLRADLDAQS